MNDWKTGLGREEGSAPSTGLPSIALEETNRTNRTNRRLSRGGMLRPKRCRICSGEDGSSTRALVDLTKDGHGVEERCQEQARDHRREPHRPGTSAFQNHLVQMAASELLNLNERRSLLRLTESKMMSFTGCESMVGDDIDELKDDLWLMINVDRVVESRESG